MLTFGPQSLPLHVWAKCTAKIIVVDQRSQITVILSRKVCFSCGQIRSISWLSLVLRICQTGVVTSQVWIWIVLVRKKKKSTHCVSLSTYWIVSFTYSADLSFLTRLTPFPPFFPSLYPSSKCKMWLQTSLIPSWAVIIKCLINLTSFHFKVTVILLQSKQLPWVLQLYLGNI